MATLEMYSFNIQRFDLLIYVTFTFASWKNLNVVLISYVARLVTNLLGFDGEEEDLERLSIEKKLNCIYIRLVFE